MTFGNFLVGLGVTFLHALAVFAALAFLIWVSAGLYWLYLMFKR